jgi:Zn-dependent peptidase ImmA (M78 family)
MRRGFKADAERRAETIRRQMRRRVADRADAIHIAQYLGAEVRRADELTSLAKLQALEELQPGSFSACTFSFRDRHVIVYSPLASLGRAQSDIAHEVAHILLDHEIKEVQQLGGLSFFTCDPDEEQEANWQAGCLLLPRSVLLAAAKRGLDAGDIAETFGVSESMAGFRLRATGVLRQLQAGS